MIYIKIANPNSIINLHAKLQQAIQSDIFLKQNERQLEVYPHITIATRDLQENIFPQAGAAYMDRDYTAEFMVNELKLYIHNGKSWSSEENFSFGNST